jgi:hypothetical protein
LGGFARVEGGESGVFKLALWKEELRREVERRVLNTAMGGRGALCTILLDDYCILRRVNVAWFVK